MNPGTLLLICQIEPKHFYRCLYTKISFLLIAIVSHCTTRISIEIGVSTVPMNKRRSNKMWARLISLPWEVWQNRLWNFTFEDTKSNRLLPKSEVLYRILFTYDGIKNRNYNSYFYEIKLLQSLLLKYKVFCMFWCQSKQKFFKKNHNKINFVKRNHG